ncbi:hypothetical protein MKW92_010807 [Papaver armeniacum]|nr:hypothetical protein MKW92_010807 [Papaver armeniacum]
MASSSSLFILFTITIQCLILALAPQTQAQAPTAPAGPINLTQILEKGGQFTTFMRLLNSTQVSSQVNSQIKTSSEGMTIFAPSDNAFNNLKPGTLNGLSLQEQIELVLYHVLPKYYSMVNFQTVSNPVRTQASDQGGKPFGLNFTTTSNQVNISTGIVETQLNNALRQEFPLGVYQVDQVLLPNELFGTKTPSATSPSSEDPADAKAPGTKSGGKGDNSGSNNIGFSTIFGFGLVLMGIMF